MMRLANPANAASKTYIFNMCNSASDGIFRHRRTCSITRFTLWCLEAGICNSIRPHTGLFCIHFQWIYAIKPDSAYLLTLELLKFAELHQDKKGIATAYNLQGSSWDARGNYPRALECFEKGLETAERIQSRHQIAGALNNIGTVYNNWEIMKKPSAITKGA